VKSHKISEKSSEISQNLRKFILNAIKEFRKKVLPSSVEKPKLSSLPGSSKFELAFASNEGKSDL
jgi:hypothetical protein